MINPRFRSQESCFRSAFQILSSVVYGAFWDILAFTPRLKPSILTMAPIVRSLPSYVKDSQHAFQIFRDFNFLCEDKPIFTMDITSLYTVIPNDEGLLALKHFF